MFVGDTRILEIRTRQQFVGVLRKHPILRAFVTPTSIVAWDANAEVHPDVRKGTGIFGIPVQMDATSISLRPHGLDLPHVKQMYRELFHSLIIKRIYGGSLPAIELDDEYNTEFSRIDNLGWENEDDDADGDWEDEWVSY